MQKHTHITLCNLVTIISIPFHKLAISYTLSQVITIQNVHNLYCIHKRVLEREILVVTRLHSAMWVCLCIPRHNIYSCSTVMTYSVMHTSIQTCFLFYNPYMSLFDFFIYLSPLFLLANCTLVSYTCGKHIIVPCRGTYVFM